MQDCDYLSDRILFGYISRIRKIPMISLDHSIQIYDHLFLNNYSDFRITWGEYQINRIKRLAKILPQKMISCGRPSFEFNFKMIDFAQNKIWTFLLPAFQEANMQSIHRSLDQTKSNIALINKIISVNYPGIKLIVKPHPSDELKNFNFGIAATDNSLNDLMYYSQLVFIEDSTISLEVLNYNVPVIYFSDDKVSDNLHLMEFEVDYIFCRKEDRLEDKITEALNVNIDSKKRRQTFQHYFGDGKNFEIILNSFLDGIHC